MTEPRQISFDEVVRILKDDLGTNAYVEQTGGGTATIFAGEQPDGDARWDVCAGPGWFEGPGWTNGRGSTDDFYIGPDDDGEADPVVAQPDWDEHRIAREIARFTSKEDNS